MSCRARRSWVEKQAPTQLYVEIGALGGPCHPEPRTHWSTVAIRQSATKPPSTVHSQSRTSGLLRQCCDPRVVLVRGSCCEYRRVTRYYPEYRMIRGITLSTGGLRGITLSTGGLRGITLSTGELHDVTLSIGGLRSITMILP